VLPDRAGDKTGDQEDENERVREEPESLPGQVRGAPPSRLIGTHFGQTLAGFVVCQAAV
jgi:hypothetical protein